VKKNASFYGLETKLAEFSGEFLVPLIIVSTKDLKALKSILQMIPIY
jgi:hypothetical protein